VINKGVTSSILGKVLATTRPKRPPLARTHARMGAGLLRRFRARAALRLIVTR
jgi:hypothetical protein